jgi:hypothetical protein
MIGQKKTLLSIAVGLVLAGCGGGGNSGAPAVQPSITTSGKAVDGYLSGSLVVCDTNNNGAADAGEATTTTNGTGDFTFPSACAATIVVSGGTNIDTGLSFKGVLKAPAGSLVATPLTTLMADGGLTAVQVAAALGLPAGTDVTKLDPVLPANFDLQKKTLAIQQVIQQVTDTLGGLAKNASPAALEAIYSAVAKSVVATLVANPTATLISASGAVSATLVSAVIVDSVKKVEASTDASLANSKAVLAAYSGSSIAELVSGAIVTQAQTLASATSATTLTASASSLQANTTIAGAATAFATLLTTASDSTVNLTVAAAALTTIADTNATDASKIAAAANIQVAATVQATAAGVTPPVVDTAAWATPSNVLAISNDNIELNGVNYTLQNFATGNGVVLAAGVSSLDTVRFVYDVKGTPIPANAQGVMTTRVSLGVELSDTGTKGQVLQFILDQADITVDANKQLAVSVPAGAQLYAYGKTANGTTANVTLTNIGADQFLVVANNQLSFNAGKVLTKLVPSQATFSGLQNIKGTFNLKVVVSNLSIAGQTQTSVQGLSVSVTGASKSMSGLGVQGKFTAQ